MRIAGLYKNAYSGLSPATWWLSVVMVVNRSGTMVIPFMTLYLTESLHFSIGRAGVVMAIFGAGAVCGGLLGGKLTDKFGFYNTQLLSLIFGGIFFIVLGQMRSYPMICAFTFILSLLNDSFRPANSTAIAHYSKVENRTRSYSLNRLAINIGWALGGALGGLIASKNYHLLFWVDGLTNIAAAILLRAVLAPTKNSQTPAKKQPLNDESIVKTHAYKDKAYIAFIILTMLFAYCFFQTIFILPLYYRQHMGMLPAAIGMVMALNGLLIAAFEMVIIYQLEGKRKTLSYVSIGAVVTALSFFIFNIFQGGELLAIIAVVFATVGEMLSMPFMNTFWIGRTSDNNRGQYAGLYTVAWSCAQVLSPYTGAQIVQHFGFSTLWWVAGGICILTAIGFKWLQLRT